MIENLVSVVIPFYNGEKYIKRAVDSVLHQTYKKIELILVDNGSQDNAKTIIDEINDDRINYYYLEEANVSKARNFGIEKSNGEFIYFMDSDDTIDDECIELCINLMRNQNTELILFALRHIDNNNDSIDEYLPFNSQKMSHKTIIEKLVPNIIYPLGDETKIMGSMWRVFTYSKNIKKIKFNEKVKYAEDLLYCIELLCSIDNLYIYNKIFYNYYSNGNSTLNSYKKDVIYTSQEFHEALEDLMNKLNINNENILKRLKYTKGRMYTTAISFAVRCNKFSIALSDIKRIYIEYKKDKYDYYKLEYEFLIKFTFILLKIHCLALLCCLYMLKEKIRKLKYR